MVVIHNFGNLHVDNFQWLNSANIMLLPKKDGAEDITEFRPISLIHAIAKIVSKMLAARLSPHMNNLISNAQSAFIKKRSIHDNFMYVRNLARRLHKNKTPSLLFKLDIRKAFDSVRWEYVLDILQRRDFPSRFRDWIVAILSTSSSWVLLNGVPGSPISHGKGLRQGDPLSPYLFLSVADGLVHLLKKEIVEKNLTPIKIARNSPGISNLLFADDSVVFLEGSRDNFEALHVILQEYEVA